MAIDTVEEITDAAKAVSPSPSVSEASAALVAASLNGIVEVTSRGRGIGAGIIWDAAGQVMTNHHVVVGTGGRPQVVLTDGRRFETKVVAENPALDLALLEVEASGLPALPIGDSRTLRIGELVFAVGHPWGVKGVVTAGIVSGLGSVTSVRSGRSADYIRSDVSLAPGNSGGPLLNARGHVVGINSMIFGGDLSVAVPSHVALEWLARAGQRVYLGVGVRPVRINHTGEDSDGPTEGVIVIGVDPKGPASRAGVTVGDVLLSVADQHVVDTASLRKALSQGVSDGKAELIIVRGGKARKVQVDFDKAA
ncbi:MAG: trypsin-like peptidase domain-containing protein [Chloroflexota bacterium]